MPHIAQTGDALTHDAQTILRTRRHRQGQWVPLNSQLADVSLTSDVGDFNAVGGEEAGDFLIAGVAAHEWGLLRLTQIGDDVRHILRGHAEHSGAHHE